MKHKPIYFTQATLPPMEEYIDEMQELWDSHWITNMGTKHKTLQKQLETYLGVRHVELLVNGHMALEMAIQALGLTGEVITTPFTFASTTHAIVRSGLTPVFCDIKSDDYTIDVSAIESLITERTSAIIPVHVYGNICDVEAIKKIADKYNLKVIYDAAHAFGETYSGCGVGTFGDVSCFSFHATKVFNSIEGGAACFSDESIGEKLYDLKNFGIHGPETVSGIGANAKMNEFCAAMGICNLHHVDDEIARRKAVDERYRQKLTGIPGITLNPQRPGLKRNYAYFPVLFDREQFGASRDEITERLAAENIFVRKYFYPLTSQYDCYAGQFNPTATPVALDISQRIFILPMYSDLPLEEVDRICEVILNEK